MITVKVTSFHVLVKTYFTSFWASPPWNFPGFDKFLHKEIHIILNCAHKVVFYYDSLVYCAIEITQFHMRCTMFQRCWWGELASLFPTLSLCCFNGKTSALSMCIPDGSKPFVFVSIQFVRSLCSMNLHCFKLDSISLNTKWNSVWSIQPLELVRNPKIGLDFLLGFMNLGRGREVHKANQPESLSLGFQKKCFVQFLSTDRASCHHLLDLYPVLPKWPH